MSTHTWKIWCFVAMNINIPIIFGSIFSEIKTVIGLVIGFSSNTAYFHIEMPFCFDKILPNAH